MVLVFFVFCEKSFNRINKNPQKFTTRGRVLLLNVRQTFSLLIKKKCFSFHMMKGWKVAKNALFFVKVCYLLLFVIGVKIRLDLSKYPKMMLGL